MATQMSINPQGAKKDILLSLAIIFVPNLILTAVLLGLVFHYQVPQTHSELPGVSDPLAREPSAYLVDFSATKLLTVASWTSTLSSLLPSFAMALVSFPVARKIANASKNKRTDDLPTPYQLSMLLGVLSGSVGSLWAWFKYRNWKKRELVNDTAKKTITWLVFVSLLGYLIVIADTWLHISTSTIILSQTSQSQSAVSTFGRGLNVSESQCFIDDGPVAPCSVAVGNHGPHFINAVEAYQALTNTSNQNSIVPFTHEGKSYALIADTNIPPEVGYQAQSFAVNTQCAFLSKECTSMYHSWQGPWHCSDNFLGFLPNWNYSGNYSSNPSWALAGVQFFQDSGLTQNFSNIGGSGKPGVSLFGSNQFTPANPVYIGAWGLLLGYLFSTGTASTLLNTIDFLFPETPGLGFILGCNMTAYDLNYVWYNGSVLVQQMVLSNTSLVRILTAPFVTELANLLPLGQTAIGQATPSAFLDTWATGFSSMALALSSGIMSPRVTVKEQTAISMLVARIPKAPLAVLVFLTLLYASVGILLACMAAQGGTGEAKIVQGYFSVTGLAAKCFENEDRCEAPVREVEELFAEKEVGARDQRCSKVSLVASRRGGWKYELMERDGMENAVLIDELGSKTPWTHTRQV
ncbi:hypothetical protein BGZ57DRAFT_967313 [Hyaloscypha finlandica]|nr:hypothetical protein BGZ57DRAFT_967313 [Hyaloscypha finlandica]